MRTIDEVHHAFNPVKTDATQSHKIMLISKAFEDLAGEILSILPDTGERYYVLRGLLEGKIMAVQILSHHIEPVQKKK
jgi:hypothetical protein